MKKPLSFWLEPLIVYLVTRASLFLVAYLADLFYPNPILSGLYFVAPELPWLDVWARWDSAFYLSIASQGYQLNLTEVSNVAFFPLYPLLIKGLDTVIHNQLISALLVSHAAFLAALYVLQALCRLEQLPEVVRQRVLWLVATFPGAFFFSAVYTESLFLLLSLLVFYCARSKNFAIATLFAMLGGATRITGILLCLVLLLEWYKTPNKPLKSALIFLLAPLGFLSHMLFLWITFDDPIAFWNVQGAFNRTGFNPLAAIWRDLAPLVSGIFSWNVILDLSAFALVLGCLPRIHRRFGVSFSLYCFLSVLIPISSGTGSLLRYTSVLFPVFMALGLIIQDRKAYIAMQTLFFTLMLVLAGVFANWIFVA